jgi:glutathione S-transferase
MTLPVLTIGNKNYSSWSMRPWLALHWAGIAFTEEMVTLGEVGARPTATLRAASPSGLVPVLALPSGTPIHDSLAIAQWAAEVAPDAGLWPQERIARARTWSAVAEMHSGFAALRRNLPMNLRRRTGPRTWDEATRADIARIFALWDELKGAINPHGPWLNGARAGIVDAFFAPVATRLRTYAVPLTPVAEAWSETLFTDRAFAAWDAAAACETAVIAGTDAA